MKKILVFQHVAHEILGTFHPLLKQERFRIRYANFGRHPEPEIEMKRYDGLIILGGPMGAYEVQKHPHLSEELKAIREAIRADKPVLGICLGAQLIAMALGAEVKPNPETEIGWYPVSLTEEGRKDPVLSELQTTEQIFQWHGDTFAIPEGATWLAKSEVCPPQAFRFSDKVYGFQFHLEVDESMIERWLRLAAKNPSEGLNAKVDTALIRQTTPQHIGRLKELSRKVFSRYIGLFSTKRRTILLGSGHK